MLLGDSPENLPSGVWRRALREGNPLQDLSQVLQKGLELPEDGISGMELG